MVEHGETRSTSIYGVPVVASGHQAWENGWDFFGTSSAIILE